MDQNNPPQIAPIKQNETAAKSEGFFSKNSLRIFGFLFLGSLGWSYIGLGMAWEFGFGGDVNWIIKLIILLFCFPALPFLFLYPINPLLGIFGVLALSVLIALIIKISFGMKRTFIFSLAYLLIPVVFLAVSELSNFASGFYFYINPTPQMREQTRIDQERRIEQDTALKSLKSKLPVMEPTYLLDFMKKEEENLWSEKEIQIKYTGGLFIYEYQAPLSYFDSNIDHSGSKKTVDIGNGVIASIIPYGANGTSYITFEYAGVAFRIFYNPDARSSKKQPLISENELLKIVRSIIKD